MAIRRGTLALVRRDDGDLEGARDLLRSAIAILEQKVLDTNPNLRGILAALEQLEAEMDS